VKNFSSENRLCGSRLSVGVCAQLWTMYCESLAAMRFTDSESYVNAHQTVMDFWGRVTPGILQLLSHSKVVRSTQYFAIWLLMYWCTATNHRLLVYKQTQQIILSHRYHMCVCMCA